MDLQTKLAQGIAAAQAGRKAEARQLLIEVVKADQKQVTAWQWLKEVVDRPEDKTVCLERILALDPANSAAKQELSRLQAKPKQPVRPKYLDEAPDVEAEDEPTAVTPDEFANEWLCPYCTTLTKPKQTRCPKCLRRLVIARPVSDRSSTWLWRGIFVQLALVIFLLLLGVGLFALFPRWQGITNPWPFLPVYLGLPVDRSADAVRNMLRAFPRGLFWNIVGLMGYSLGLLAVLYYRVRFGNFLYLFNALATLGVVFWSAYVYFDHLLFLLFSMVGFLFGLAQFAVAIATWNEFNYRATRLRLRADSDANNHTSNYLSGRRYGERGMWGAAILHFRRAVAGDPANLAYRLALTIAYLKVARTDQAQKELLEAKKIAPHSTDVQRLEQKLVKL